MINFHDFNFLGMISMIQFSYFFVGIFSSRTNTPKVLIPIAIKSIFILKSVLI